ncbi:hypothetical protein QBC37DRAFT_9404 [Rhypophila decipiens]|uniref:Uncharacterized protein n=1 Tax=Rhypophila decipiens TaxID=261697 RepID=A0AAN6YGQ5_9PEZI|nr:hypothetical protein QBC37DRAFT_9404 [Rhypophila decipiens]
MADTAESAAEAHITFKVKSSNDKVHTITMPESAKVLELKQKLATAEFEGVAVERQRLIYSGRVLKNDDALSVYKIKHLNTIHMVKSAASNPTPAPAASTSSTPAQPAIPQNMAAGASAGNLLAGLTGARFAGLANLPSRDMFGADGGMGAAPNEDQIADMLSNPAIAQTMNEALNNPAFVDQMIQSNPMLANMPNAREMLQSPYFRNMMTNPEALRAASRLRRMYEAPPSFPAPGVTDTTPQGENSNNPAGSGAVPPFPGFPGAPFGTGAAGGANPFAALMAAGANPFAGFGAPTNPTPSAPASNAPSTGTPSTGAQDTANNSAQPAQANPFAALFNAPQATGSPAAQNPFGNPEALQQLMQLWGGPGGLGGLGGAGSPPPPADNRPPEERYAEQLRQLNDMGFFDFDRNIAALRRSGGSVQGAIEHLLNN